jgi:predicted PurR-regulated permease PerM
MRSEAFAWFVRGIGLATGVGLIVAIGAGIFASVRVLFLVFLAILLASALEPLIGWLRGRLPLGRTLTILAVYAVFFAGVIVFAFLVIPAAINQFNDLTQRLPPFFERAREATEQLRPRALATSARALVAAAQEALAPKAPDPDDVVALGLTAAEIAVSAATLLAIVFFWLTEHARLQRFALAFLPQDRRGGVREAWNAIESRLGSWVRGQLLLMGTMAAATSVAYAVLGLDSWLLLGVIAGLAEAIPIVGPLVGAVPALLVAATISPELTVAVAVVYVIIQIVEGNVLVPLIMRNTIGISPFLIIVSLLLGGAIGGIPGAFLAVPLMAALVVILERLQARETPVPQDPASLPDEDDEVDTSAESKAKKESRRENRRSTRRTRERGSTATG